MKSFKEIGKPVSKKAITFDEMLDAQVKFLIWLQCSDFPKSKKMSAYYYFISSVMDMMDEKVNESSEFTQFPVDGKGVNV